MLAESNKIILVDDNEDDLKRLSEVFQNKGIGSRQFKYDVFYDSPLSGVHILFIDINLNNSNESDDKKRNATLRDALNHYIDKNNGPYVLVFWTSNVGWKKSFLEFMQRDNGSEDLPASPFFVTTMAKNDFSVEKIDALFGESPVRILFEYEESMSNSISNATTQILNTIPKDSLWGETCVFDDNCKAVFMSIAKQIAGYEYAKQDPDKAIKEALIPLYAHSFLNGKSHLWNDCLRKIFDEKKKNEISFPSDYNIAKLNTIFHIDYNTELLSKECRGVVSNIAKSEFNDFFSISYQEWFGITLPGIEKSIRDNMTNPICVEFSSACDFSQRKKRTLKYLLGVMCPVEIIRIIENNGNRTENPIKLGDYSFVIKEPFFIDGKSIVFCFNLNYTFTINKINSKIIENPICQFKKELMDMIGNRYANHISRIGITSFR